MYMYEHWNDVTYSCRVILWILQLSACTSQTCFQPSIIFHRDNVNSNKSTERNQIDIHTLNVEYVIFPCSPLNFFKSSLSFAFPFLVRSWIASFPKIYVYRYRIFNIISKSRKHIIEMKKNLFCAFTLNSPKLRNF